MIVATPGAVEATSNQQRINMLLRHASGDWSVVCEEDNATNNEALKIGARVLSAYPIDPALVTVPTEDTFWLLLAGSFGVASSPGIFA